MKVKINYKVGGIQVTEAEYKKAMGDRLTGIAYQRPSRVRVRKGKQVKFPVYNDSLGIHPSQKKSMEERNRLHGTGVMYTNDGRAIIESESQLKRQMKLDQRIDRRGYYSV